MTAQAESHFSAKMTSSRQESASAILEAGSVSIVQGPKGLDT